MSAWRGEEIAKEKKAKRNQPWVMLHNLELLKTAPCCKNEG